MSHILDKETPLIRTAISVVGFIFRLLTSTLMMLNLSNRLFIPANDAQEEFNIFLRT
jgi:hypothetical protein